VPGEEVRVILKNPMVVVQLGYAQIALDKTLAAGVFIRRR
ncbi:MAG TPA: ferrous iron transport protein A, partial [Firmicutes bacterium]|nr:ferrous iron transport protein A [Bacillota bacterium]